MYHRAPSRSLPRHHAVGRAAGDAATSITSSVNRRDTLALHLAGAICLLSGSSAVAPPASAKSESGDWSSPGLATPVDPDAPKFTRTASGVRYQEVALGSGPIAEPGDSVLFDYVLRRSNGYFIYGTLEGVSFQPRDVPVGPVSFKLGGGELIPVGWRAARRAPGEKWCAPLHADWSCTLRSCVCGFHVAW